MPIICDEYDLLFTHVPKTGGSFVEKVLLEHLGGRRVAPRHGTFRWVDLAEPPTRRVFTVRNPVSWYRSYWAYARSSTRHPDAWPIWEGGDRRHPTRELDRRCGAANFDQFVANSLREFPNGFVRSMYCDFLNGCTHALRSERLTADLERLLEVVGFSDPAFVRGLDAVGPTPERWKSKAVLPRSLEQTLGDVENLDGLEINYVD